MLVRGCSAINMFLNSKMSEIDPRGGQHFSNKSEIKKSLKYPMGGQAYLGHCPKIFPFLSYDASPYFCCRKHLAIFKEFVAETYSHVHMKIYINK